MKTSTRTRSLTVAVALLGAVAPVTLPVSTAQAADETKTAKRTAPAQPELPPLHFNVKAFDDIGISADHFVAKLKAFAKEIGLKVTDEKTDKSYEVNVTVGFDDDDDDNDGTPDADDKDADGDGVDDDTEGSEKVDLDKGIPALTAKLENDKEDRGLYFIITNQQKAKQVRFNTKADSLNENSEKQKETIQTIVGILVGEVFDVVDTAEKGKGNAETK